MTLTKKHWTIIGVVAVLVAIYFIFIRKRKYSESSFDTALPLIGENSYEGSETDHGVIESGYVRKLCPEGYKYDAVRNACVKMFAESGYTAAGAAKKCGCGANCAGFPAGTTSCRECCIKEQ